MPSSSLRAVLIEWSAMACAVAVFVGAALDTPDVPSTVASPASVSAQPGR